ncbi:hypothetical protein E2I00_003147 [Balaenoptera physalus]|uniref:Inhibin alpha chain n=1 Tax=Balaenoptera physalus TaxID=9770 RepID=A0A643CGH6_BALPH|nr:hypothetical protein E2I00_003147 [Balaenoptera physalus]
MLLLLLAPRGGHGCHGPELDRELVLAKVRALFLDALGAPAVTGEGGNPGVRRLPRRHAVRGFTRRASEPEEEDVSQAILFPVTGNEALGKLMSGSHRPPAEEESPGFCQSGLLSAFPLPPTGASLGDEPAAGELAQEAKEGLFTYVFRPSQHTRSRQVTSAQLWFHTGLDRQETAAANSSGPLLGLLALSSGGPTAVPMSLGQAPPRWAVLHLAASAFPLLTHPVLEPAAHADCHRAALNISFQELGWERWIVHPPSFIFHYCHGGCGLSTPPDLSLPVPGAPPTPVQPLSLVPGAQPCCAALPGTMRPLRVRTTSDGGYSFKYETVPNLLTQHCACI